MKFGLLGRKLGHSYSPMIFDLMGGYRYDLFEREPEGIEDLLKNGDFDGLNVTIPYKKEVLQYLDEIDPLALRLGAVNTIVKKDGKLFGYNSDYYGFLSLVQRTRIEPQNKKVLVLGSGGASVTVRAVLEDLGAQVVLISRSGEDNYTNLDRHRDAALIVNTTPVGMYPHNGSAPLSLEGFTALEGVLDLIYNPARTQLLMECEKYGIPGFNGLWMLVAQAKQSAQWFLGRELPDSLVSDIHQKLRDKMENIALVGMAGCGKSTLGRALAKETGKKFVDADAEVEDLAGKSIPEIFAQEGEEMFRRMETTVLAELGMQSGLVIATGGGCVTREENYPLLHQNSRIIWLDRCPARLPTEGRPLSQKTHPAQLYEMRKPLYKAFADAAVDNNGTKGETVTEILNLLEVL
ncbi:MAG: shikimate kinase [Oscillospiraceae bacterium]|nr:shikimate kinase [Oscillospiraceae bacterium]